MRLTQTVLDQPQDDRTKPSSPEVSPLEGTAENKSGAWSITASQRELIIEQALRDPQYRDYLLSSPSEAIRSLTGIVIPDSVRVAIHQETADVVHILANTLPITNAQGSASDVAPTLVPAGTIWEQHRLDFALPEELSVHVHEDTEECLNIILPHIDGLAPDISDGVIQFEIDFLPEIIAGSGPTYPPLTTNCTQDCTFSCPTCTTMCLTTRPCSTARPGYTCW